MKRLLGFLILTFITFPNAWMQNDYIRIESSLSLDGNEYIQLMISPEYINLQSNKDIDPVIDYSGCCSGCC